MSKLLVDEISDADGTGPVTVTDGLNVSSGAVFNEAGLDVDFRVESDTITHALFVDGSNGYIGINDSAPSAQLDLNTSDGLMTILNSTHASGGYVRFEKSGTVYGDLGNGAQIVSGGATTAFGMNTRGTGDLLLATNGVTRASIQNGGAFTTNPLAGGHAVFNEGGADADFRVESVGNANMLYVDGGANHVGIGQVPSNAYLHIKGNFEDDYAIKFNNTKGDGTAEWGFRSHGTNGETFAFYDVTAGQQYMAFSNTGTEGVIFNEDGQNQDFRVESQTNANCFKIDASADGGVGTVLFGQSIAASTVNGAYFSNGGTTEHLVICNTEGTASTGLIYLNRQASGGPLIIFRAGGADEGSISVSGTTVSYNGGHLSRWSQFPDNTKADMLKGTVMTNLDQMASWFVEDAEATYYTEDDELPEDVLIGDEKTPAIQAHYEDNEQLNCMDISSVEGDQNVAGVFVSWDLSDNEAYNDMNIAMTGDMIIRIAHGTTVARGDLLMSAGDGTAKPQGDDIVRGKTIAKVTSTHVTCTYDDGSYCVPCVLMAC